MKKNVVLILALMMSVFTFAQKKEIKEAEKAIKGNNFANAKSAISAAEALISAMDDKTKAKFYFLKAQALYAAGNGSDADIAEAFKSFTDLTDLENRTGKKTYTPKVEAMKQEMVNNFVKKGSDAYEQKNYSEASLNFESAYRASTRDTVYLYNSATVSVMEKNYDRAIVIYNELMDLGYTGIATEYRATLVESGEEETFPNETMRDLSVRGKSHNNPRDVKTDSKVGEIAKNVALIYIEQGKTEEAIAAIERAKKSNPNDVNLILSEANAYYKMGNNDKYKELITKALELDPTNVDLVFNLGVFAAQEDNYEEAKGYYDKAIKMDSSYKNAYMNMAALILNQEQKIIDEMNNLGTSAADNKKYDDLKNQRQQLYKDAVPYLSSVLDLDQKDIGAARTLMNIYSALDDMPNFKAMKAKVEELEAGGN
jgi:tetratricopeptide (TPR) repeat protein